MQTVDVRRHGKPSAAYVEAALAVEEALKAIGNIGMDCRQATWTNACEMASLALELQKLVRQFGGCNATRT